MLLLSVVLNKQLEMTVPHRKQGSVRVGTMTGSAPSRRIDAGGQLINAILRSRALGPKDSLARGGCVE